MSDYKWVNSTTNEDGTFDLTVQHRITGEKKVLKNCFPEDIKSTNLIPFDGNITFNITFYDGTEKERMGSTYIHKREIASFSKEDYLFTVEEQREEPSESTYNMVRYFVLRYFVYRRPLGSTQQTIVQKDLTVSELVRYLAHCAEDGSLMRSDKE